MGVLDTPLRNAARAVMGALGTSVTIRQVSLGGYNTTTRTATPTNVDTVVKGILEDYVAHEADDTVKLGDRKLTIAAADLSFEPTTQDLVLISSVIYTIVRVESLRATSQPAALVLSIRGES